jgi:quinohemoprotein ethanol dehydrogenase
MSSPVSLANLTFRIPPQAPRLANIGLMVLLVAAGCAEPAPEQRVATRIDDLALTTGGSGEDWVGFGRTYDEQRFSPLTQINDGNVGDLSVDWVLDLPTDRGLASTPLVVDGVLYFIGSMNIVQAVDATSGERLWTYDPRVREYAGRLRAGWDQSRGIAFWNDKIYVATWDGRLNAVDAATGQEVWSTTTIDPELSMYITGPPKVFKGKVLVGNGGTENGPNRGYVTAYDAETGEEAWRFWIVPGNPADGFENEAMRMAAETWTGEWWLQGGGGNAWHGFTYDAELDQLYIGTGNGSPWNRKIRSPDGGDNLFLCSVVALDPDTGEYLWHYQTVPGETWDYNSNMDIVLTDLEIDGRERQVMLHAPKNGFFYVIDRTNGELISADPFVETTWASHIDLETGRPVEVPGSRYESGIASVTPTEFGGHNWHAMSFNTQTGLAYYPAMHRSRTYSDVGFDLGSWRGTNWLVGVGVGGARGGSTHQDGWLSTLQAWDPVRQELVWEVPLPGFYSPGTMTTAGNLVFQGRVDGVFAAYRADTGAEVWSTPLGLGIQAPPITYSVDGRQYVALLVGWGGVIARGRESAQHGWAYGLQTRRLVAFSLDGTADLPAQPDPFVPVPIEADFDVDSELATVGAQIYGQRCGICHGSGAVAGGLTPDLRASLLVPQLEAFASVVRDGVKAVSGMPAYVDITFDELTALQHYIRQTAETALAAMEESGPR